ncbi:MAG TPA: sterol desaturase family protein [Solirubrobacteraceae bacterium]|nr:sterol desaturase family protein [Solirubrobacteraceae bacterium]
MSSEAPSPRRTDILRASPRMFESDILDKLSRVHPSVPVIIFVPAIVALALFGLERNGVPGFLGLLLGGYIVWTLTEYWLHRIVFHFEPDAKWGRRLHWIIHGVHHDHPNDPMRLVMPPSVSVPLALLFYGLFAFTLGPDAAPALGAGFFAGYLFYDMTHYHVHHHKPKTWAGRKLRELHMRHHFQDHTKSYGVSAPWWDTIFGTAAKRRRKERAAG